MPEFVRVSDNRTGHHYTTTRVVAEGDPHLSILKSDALDANGRPRAFKPKTRPAARSDEKATTAAEPTEANKEATK